MGLQVFHPKQNILFNFDYVLGFKRLLKYANSEARNDKSFSCDIFSFSENYLD